MDGAKLAQWLRAIAALVERLDDKQIDGLLIELRSRKFVASNPSGKDTPSKKRKHAKIDPIALQEIVSRLSSIPTREEGMQLLNNLNFNRKELETLARLSSILVLKDDSVGKIKEKLVEVLIGSRLSSQAIRGP